MNEESFRAFYEATAGGLRAYLRYRLQNSNAVDDLLQESYFRFLKANLPEDMDQAHRKNYLYRIATNLIHDSRRLRQFEQLADQESLAFQKSIEAVQDVKRALTQLKPKQRELLWLAYVEGFRHDEIAGIVKVKTPSIRPMLARARAQFVKLMKGGTATDPDQSKGRGHEGV
jgi:RNA polymerase sigma-70 factor (ECF subfamily)